jgi:hypothetical protein
LYKYKTGTDKNMTTLKMDKLTLEISEKQTEVNLQKEYIEKLQKELLQFSDSNFNLRVQVNQKIPNDKGLSPTQILAEMERLENLENTRIKKLENYEKTCVIFKEKIKQAQSDLSFSESQLAKLLEEKDWQDNYSKEAEKYREGFINKAQKEYAQKLNGFDYELNKWQSKAQIIERFLRDPRCKEKTCVLEPMKALNYGDAVAEQPRIAGHIKNLETAIQNLKDSHELFLASLNINPVFRKFIRDRVNIELAATDLKQAQDSYLEKLKAFSKAKGSSNTAISYSGNRGIDYFQMLIVNVGDQVVIGLKDIEV